MHRDNASLRIYATWSSEVAPSFQFPVFHFHVAIKINPSITAAFAFNSLRPWICFQRWQTLCHDTGRAQDNSCAPSSLHPSRTGRALPLSQTLSAKKHGLPCAAVTAGQNDPFVSATLSKMLYRKGQIFVFWVKTYSYGFSHPFVYLTQQDLFSVMFKDVLLEPHGQIWQQNSQPHHISSVGQDQSLVKDDKESLQSR